MKRPIYLIAIVLVTGKAHSSNQTALTSREAGIFEGSIVSFGEKRFRLVEYIEELGVSHHHERFGSLLLLLPSTATLLNTTTQTPRELVLLKEVRPKDSCIHGEYCADTKIFKGGHGDVWRGYAINKDGVLDSVPLVLKRMGVYQRDDILRCALREIYFGKLLRGNPRFTTFISSFTDQDSYWLVFKDEGISLRHLIYSLVTREGVSAIYEPSLLWRKMRKSAVGANTLRGIMHQLITTVGNLHEQGLAHRDIKPSNILLSSSGRGGQERGDTRVILGDWSSAVDAESLSNLYGALGPGDGELSMSHAPPEARLSTAAAIRDESLGDSIRRYQQYDAWSVGVVFLELFLGTDDVFLTDVRSEAIIKQRLQRLRTKTSGRDPDSDLHREQDALFLAGLADYCIVDEHTAFPSFWKSGGATELSLLRGATKNSVPGDTSEKSISSSCSPRAAPRSFAHAVRKRDPLGLGLTDVATGTTEAIGSDPRLHPGAVDLLMRLLAFEPSERITMKQALKHPYFMPTFTEAEGQGQGEGEGEGEGGVGVAGETDLPLPLLGIGVDPLEDTASFEAISEKIPQKTVGDTITSTTLQLEPIFVCPACRRSFTDWASCHLHMTKRRHNESSDGSRCLYSSAGLPECSSEHTLLPLTDGRSGWCDVTGRRRHLEDTHSLHFGPGFALYGVFDGHLGSRASRFSSRFLPVLFERYLAAGAIDPGSPEVDTLEEMEENDEDEEDRRTMGLGGAHARLLKLNPSSVVWSSLVLAKPDDLLPGNDGSKPISVHRAAAAMALAFRHAAASFLGQFGSQVESSGSTAAVAVLFHNQDGTTSGGGPTHLLVANVGDSRVIMVTSSGAVAALTTDHTPREASEARRVLRRGGFLSPDPTSRDQTLENRGKNQGQIRVNGRLAVTRAIGDAPLASVLTAEPDLVMVKLATTRGDLGAAADSEATHGEGDGEQSMHLQYNEAIAPACRRLVRQLKPQQEMFVVLASDGLFDVLSNREVAELVCDRLLDHIGDAGAGSNGDANSTNTRTATPRLATNGQGLWDSGVLQAAARALVQEAFVRGSSDNICAVVVGLGGLGGL